MSDETNHFWTWIGFKRWGMSAQEQKHGINQSKEMVPRWKVCLPFHAIDCPHRHQWLLAVSGNSSRWGPFTFSGAKADHSSWQKARSSFWIIGLSYMNCTCAISPEWVNEIEVRKLWRPLQNLHYFSFLVLPPKAWLGLVFWIIVMPESPSASHVRFPGCWMQISLSCFLITCFIPLSHQFDDIGYAVVAHTPAKTSILV